MDDIEKRAHDLAIAYISRRLSDSNTILSDREIPKMVETYRTAYAKILSELKQE